MLEGYMRRERKTNEKMAWMVIHIINGSGKLKKSITSIEKLIGRDPFASDKFKGKSKEDVQKELQEVKDLIRRIRHG